MTNIHVSDEFKISGQNLGMIMPLFNCLEPKGMNDIGLRIFVVEDDYIRKYPKFYPSICKGKM